MPPAAAADLLAACTGSCALLMDGRKPQAPLLQWAHSMDHEPPACITLLTRDPDAPASGLSASAAGAAAAAATAAAVPPGDVQRAAQPWHDAASQPVASPWQGAGSSGQWGAGRDAPGWDFASQQPPMLFMTQRPPAGAAGGATPLGAWTPRTPAAAASSVPCAALLSPIGVEGVLVLSNFGHGDVHAAEFDIGRSIPLTRTPLSAKVALNAVAATGGTNGPPDAFVFHSPAIVSSMASYGGVYSFCEALKRTVPPEELQQLRFQRSLMYPLHEDDLAGEPPPPASHIFVRMAVQHFMRYRFAKNNAHPLIAYHLVLHTAFCFI